MASYLSSSDGSSDVLEVHCLYRFTNLIVSLHTEIFLFIAAIVAHQLLFRTSKPTNHRPAKKIRATKLQPDEDDGATLSRRLSYTSSSGRNGGILAGKSIGNGGPGAALEAAFERGDLKLALSHWKGLKERSEVTPAVLVLAVECMLRMRKDHAFILREITSFVQIQANGNAALAALRDLIEALARRSDIQLIETLIATLPSLQLWPDLRMYEALLSMYFGARRFADVEKVLTEMRANSVPLSNNVLMVAVKTSLRQGQLFEARTRFKALKTAWGPEVWSSPSIAPRQLVCQLIDLACREQQLHETLPDLEGAPLNEEALTSMAVFCNRNKDARLASNVESLARRMKIELTGNMWCLLTKGSSSDPSRVIVLMGEMMTRGVEIQNDVIGYILCACNQMSDIAAADRLFNHLNPQKLPVLGSFIKFYVDQEQFERACDLYESMLKSESGGESSRNVASAGADVRLERSVMTAALRCGRAELANRFLQSSPADVARHVTMIRNCASAQNLAGAMEVFKNLEKSNPNLNSQVYNTVLDACVECGDVKQAEAWMRRMRQVGMVDVVSYNTMIKVHLHKGRFSEAQRLMVEMREQGMQPNRVTYNELVNAFVTKGDWEQRKQVWKVLGEMKAAGVMPNQVTCSILLKNLRQGSHDDDINRTMELISGMEDPMDEVLLSSVIEACVRIGKPDLVAKKLRELDRSDHRIVTGSHTFGSLIKAYGFAKNMTGVWRCWEEMRMRRVRPTSITLGCMVEAIVNNGDTETAFEFIHGLQDDDQCCDALNSVIYCSVLKGFTREKNIGRVWDVYEEMQARHVDLSIVTYNTIIDACARCGRTDRIEGLFRSMEANGIKPNVITYSTMVKGYCQAGELQRSFEILDRMRASAELRPDEIMYNSLLDGCAQHGRTEDGVRVLQLMKEEGIHPSNYTLSIVVKLMSRARRLDAAFEMVADLKREFNIRPNVHVFTNLMQACISNRALPRAMSTFEKMISARIQPEHRTYAITINASIYAGHFHQAVALLRGAYGLKEASPFLAEAREVSQCRNMDHTLVSEVLMALVERGLGQDLAEPFLADLKEMRPSVHVDKATQCKVMSAAVAQQMGHCSSSDAPPRTSWRSIGGSGNKGRGKGRTQ